MKLQFDANLHYQEQAVSAVVDLFRGQTPKQSNFTVTNLSDQGTMFTDNGVGNRLELVEDEILENLQAVQLRNFVHIHEPMAFITITNSSEIIGKGFRGFT